MCMKKFDADYFFGQNDMVLNLDIFRRLVHCNQLLIELTLNPFNIVHTCYQPNDMCM